jgi:PhnB protein
MAELDPYLFFYGRCEEALSFYKSVFGGDYESMKMKDSPMAELSPGAGDRVMHASFKGDGIAFFASDGREDKAIDPDAGNISLSLTFDDGPRGETIFAALGAGGTTTMPLDSAFWGGRFGMVTDKFGVEWMFVLP